MANGISGNAHHESKVFDAMDEWWHQTGQVMKHVSATTASYEENRSNSTLDEVKSLTTTILLCLQLQKVREIFKREP